MRLPILVLLAAAGMFAPKLLSSCPQQTERIYSRAIYPVISRVLGAASSIFPFSVAEVLIISVGTLLAVTLVVRLFKLVFSKLLKRKHNRMRFYSCLISLGMFAGIMLNLFYVFWGINHYRMPAAALLGFSDELERVNSAKSEFIAAAETGDNSASSDIYAEMLASTCEKLRLRLRRTEAAFGRTKTVCLSRTTKLREFGFIHSIQKRSNGICRARQSKRIVRQSRLFRKIGAFFKHALAP